METFLTTLFGAVVGGIISLATTYEIQKREELKKKKALATALTFRLIEAGEDIHKILSHLSKALVQDGKLAVEKDRYSEKVQQVAGYTENTLVYSVDELSLLYKEEHNDLVIKIIEVIRARNIANSLMVTYNAMKHELDGDIVKIGKFVRDEGKIRLFADFKKAEQPELMGKIYKANDLLEGLYTMCSSSYDDVRSTCDKLAVVLPTYFPKGTNLKRAEFPIV